MNNSDKPLPRAAESSVVSRIRPNAPPSLGLVEGLQALGITHLGGEKVDYPALEFGTRLRQSRLRRGWTQAQLAARVGCKQGDLSDIERGKGKDGPTYRVVRDLAVALGEPWLINPLRPVGSVLWVETADDRSVLQSCSDFRTYEPLLTHDKRHHLFEFVRRKFKNAALGNAALQSDVCTVVNVAANSKVRFKADLEWMVLTKLSGAGKVHVSNAIHRRHGTEDGGAIAVLGPESSVEVKTNEGDGLVFMMASAGALLAASCREAEEA